jgi:ribonuclease P protein component
VNRKFRLTSAADFKRVRGTGKSYAHPLVFLIASPNGGRPSRIGVSASQSFGNAVKRNRAKRRMRAAVRVLSADIQPGWDLVLTARPGLDAAGWPELLEAIGKLVRRAQLANGGSKSRNGRTA